MVERGDLFVIVAWTENSRRGRTYRVTMILLPTAAGHRLPANLPWTENRPRDHAEKSYWLVLARWMSSAYQRISDVVIKFRSRGWMMEDRNQPWSIVDRFDLSMIMRRWISLGFQTDKFCVFIFWNALKLFLSISIGEILK